MSERTALAANHVPLFDLSGHVALVTGGTGGIGLGMADGLASCGADVCIWDLSKEKNQDAASKLRRHGTRIVARQVDVSDEGQVVEAMASLVDELGRVDSCFAVAALLASGKQPKFTDISLERWREFMRVNLEGTFLTLREAARYMIDQGEGGSLVGVSSIGAQIGAPRIQHYAASKAGIAAMMRGLAVELGRYRIRCNTLVPGWTQSPSRQIDASTAEVIKRRLPLGRLGEPEDWSGIAVYLASGASAFLTGEEIRLDGGFILA